VSVEKKMKILNSVIHSLEEDSLLRASNALAHALMLRADLFLNMKPRGTDDALRDIRRASRIDSFIDNGRGWRVLADAEEAAGNNLNAINAMSKWAEVNPQFITKAQREISRLSS